MLAMIAHHNQTAAAAAAAGKLANPIKVLQSKFANHARLIFTYISDARMANPKSFKASLRMRGTYALP